MLKKGHCTNLHDVFFLREIIVFTVVFSVYVYSACQCWSLQPRRGSRCLRQVIARIFMMYSSWEKFCVYRSRRRICLFLECVRSVISVLSQSVTTVLSTSQIFFITTMRLPFSLIQQPMYVVFFYEMELWRPCFKEAIKNSNIFEKLFMLLGQDVWRSLRTNQYEEKKGRHFFLLRYPYRTILNSWLRFKEEGVDASLYYRVWQHRTTLGVCCTQKVWSAEQKTGKHRVL